MRAYALLALLLLAACGPKPLAKAHIPPGGAIRVLATPVPLNPADPTQDRAGDFVYAGGVQLKTTDTNLFGGFSDLKVSPDGDLVSETDEGSLMRAHIVLDASGRLVGLDHATIAQLKGMDGKPLPSKFEADSEGVAQWPNGDLMVSFERDHRIWLYPAAGGPPRVVPKPAASMPENEGMEGLALAPHEGADAYWVGVEAGSIWLCHLQGACEKAPGQFPPAPGYRLPALFEMADGDLVVEHHHWDPVTGTRLSIFVIDNPATHSAPKAKAELRLAPPLTVDNFEGVAVVERPGGVHRFYMIVDDNFSPTQRELLMAFDWAPSRPKAAS